MYLLVITDYFTKWSTAFALPDADVSTCMRAMYNGFLPTSGYLTRFTPIRGKISIANFSLSSANLPVLKRHTQPHFRDRADE